MLFNFFVRFRARPITKSIGNKPNLSKLSFDQEGILAGKQGKAAQCQNKPRTIFGVQDGCCIVCPMSDMLPPLSERLKWGLLVRLPRWAKHSRAIPVCPTVLLLRAGLFRIYAVPNKIYVLGGDQEIFLSVSSSTPDILKPSLQILIAAFLSRFI